jgi:hypothetical protein
MEFAPYRVVMIIYNSGVFTQRRRADLMLEDFGYAPRYRCISQAAMTGATGEATLLDLGALQGNGSTVFWDSGAYTAQSGPYSWKEHNAHIDPYLDSVEPWLDIVDFFAPMDWRRNVKTVDRSMKYMKDRMSMDMWDKLAPVYHGNDPLRHFEDYCFEHPIVMVAKPFKPGGSIVPVDFVKDSRPFLDKVFDIASKHKTKVHGLALTGKVVETYPFHSVDSTSALKTALFHNVFCYDNHGRRATISLKETIPEGFLPDYGDHFTVDRLREDDHARLVYCLRFTEGFFGKLKLNYKPKVDLI